MASFKLSGANKLEKALRDKLKLEAAKNIIKTNTNQLHNDLIENTTKGIVFVKGYSIGEIRKDISSRMPEYREDGLTSEQGTAKDYAPYLIHGTRFMEKEDFMKEPMDKASKNLKADMEKLTK